MVTNIELMNFVHQVLDKAKIQDFNLKIARRGDSIGILIKPEKSAQDFINEA